MANIFDIFKTFLPRTTILSDDFNSFQASLKAAFQKLGDARTDGKLGVDTAFAVGTPTVDEHAATKLYTDSILGSGTAAAASAAAAAVSAGEAATSATAADGSATDAAASAAAAEVSRLATIAAGGVLAFDETAKTTGFTAASGNSYATDTSGGAFTATLPASPSVDDRVGFVDDAGDWGDTSLQLGRNGSKIMGLTEDLHLDIAYASVELIYTGSARGWIFI